MNKEEKDDFICKFREDMSYLKMECGDGYTKATKFKRVFPSD